MNRDRRRMLWADGRRGFSTPIALLVAILLLTLRTVSSVQDLPSGPLHFVLVVLDSVGKGDLFTSEDRMGYSTPSFNKLASQGVVLRNYYVQTESSPTRAALLTGKYPFKIGLQEQLVTGTTAHIPLTVPTLPEMLKASRMYETHLVGGWGLGSARVEYTPTFRGFDTFYGFLGSEIDYVNKTRGKGIDFWDEVAGKTRYERAAWSAQGNYSTLQYVQRTRRVLEDYVQRHPTAKDQELTPLFLMISHQAMHSTVLRGHPEQPNRCKKASKARKQYCAMMAAVDDAMGDLSVNLQKLGLWSNTIIIVTSDSGSMVPLKGYDEETNLPITPGSTGSNYPYRGSKTTLFEGGVRGVAMISGGALDPEVKGKIYDGLAHAVDVPVFILSAIFERYRRLWMDTKTEEVAMQLTKLKSAMESLDGVPLVNVLSPSGSDGQMDFLRRYRAPRTEIPLNIDASGLDFSAVRFGRWKLIIGSSQIYRSGDGWWPSSAEGDPQLPKPDRNRFFTLYRLFDLIADPLEKVNMRNFSEVIKEGRARIRAMVKYGGYQEPQFNAFHPLSLPILHNGAWAPFLKDDSDEFHTRINQLGKGRFDADGAGIALA